MIIYFYSVSDNCLIECRTADCYQSTNFYVITYFNCSNLGYFLVFTIDLKITKSIIPDNTVTVNNNPVPKDNILPDGNIGIDNRIVSNATPLAYECIWINCDIIANSHVIIDDNICPNRNPFS